MPPVLSAEKALIFRITHRENIPWILKHGLHAASSSIQDPNFCNIGNMDLIKKRKPRPVRIGPGGTLGDYIPFYFTPFSIMMFNIHTGYNVTKVANEDIVIMVSSLRRLQELCIPFVFTNQHAYLAMAEYFTELGDLHEVKWDLLNRRDFKHDPDDPRKTDWYQAEALVWQQMPVAALLGICCYKSSVAEAIQQELAETNQAVDIRVQESWYFR